MVIYYYDVSVMMDHWPVLYGFLEEIGSTQLFVIINTSKLVHAITTAVFNQLPKVHHQEFFTFLRKRWLAEQSLYIFTDIDM